MARIPFTSEEKTLMRSCAALIWSCMSFDILKTNREQDGRDTITRDEVVELVLDADRLYKAVKQHNPSLAGRMERADARQIEGIVRDAFPFKEYA